MNATDTLYMLHVAGEPLLCLCEDHFTHDWPLGTTPHKDQAERWAAEQRAAGRKDVEVVELTF